MGLNELEKKRMKKRFWPNSFVTIVYPEEREKNFLKMFTLEMFYN